MPTFPKKVKLEAICLKQTEKALLVEIDGEQHWIPQSQVDDDSEVYKEGDEGTLVVSEWIATEKGLV
jgi:hypothetical protein